MLRNCTVRIALVALLGAASTAPGLAQERTAAIIQDLVGELEAEMTALNSRLDASAATANRLVQAEERLYEAYKTTTDPDERRELRARQLKAAAALNLHEREQVAMALETLDQVLPLIDELKHLIPRLRPERRDVHAETEFMRRFVTHAAVAIHGVRRQLQDRKHVDDLHELEEMLVSQDALYDGDLGPQRSVEALDDAFHRLEVVYVTFRQIRHTLNAERALYAAAAIRGVVDTTTDRLESLVDSSGVHGLGSAMRERVGARLRRYREIQDTDRPARRRRDGLRSPADEQRLRRIRERYRRGQ